MHKIYRVSLVVVLTIITSFQSANLCAQITSPGTEVSSLAALFDITGPDEGRAAYDPRTGEVFAAIGSSDVLVFGVSVFGGSDENLFILENLSNDSGIGDFSDEQAAVQTDPDGIGILSFNGLPSGVFNLGPILRSDTSILTAADFAAAFPTFEVLSGVTGEDAFISGMNVLVSVPEPSSFIGLMTLLVTGCCTRKRRP